MLLRTAMNHRITLLVGACLLAACVSDETQPEPEPEPIGWQVYEWRSHGVEFILYHDYDENRDKIQTVQMLRTDEDTEAIATLTNEAAAVLTSELEAVASGETDIGHFDSYCLSFIDADTATLTIPARYNILEFSYPWQCAPSGLVEIDAILADVVISMMDCSHSSYLTSCEIIP
jgi:hypothetical protein